MPGKMATETAKACLDRGFQIASVGFTGAGQGDKIVVEVECKVAYLY